MDSALHAQLQRAIEKFPGIRVALVFGSAASGRLRADSDVDVAVLAGAPLSGDEKLELAMAVSNATGREADVLDLYDAHGTILEEALCRGRRILIRDREAYELLLKRQVYDEADFMPGYRRLLQRRRERYLHG